MILYRCGHWSDNDLAKGCYWSNYVTQSKNYFNGKISVIEINLEEKFHKRYFLSKELKTIKTHDGFGVWNRIISNYDEKYNQNYYYISKEYLEKHSKIVVEYFGDEAIEYINNKLKEEEKIIKKYC